jgi:hypothetical protein
MCNGAIVKKFSGKLNLIFPSEIPNRKISLFFGIKFDSILDEIV